MSTRYLALFVLACGVATAADHDFDRVVKAIESHYRTRRTQIPLMGVANLFVKVARPAGTSSFRLAIFDHLDASGDDRDDFMARLGNGLGSGGLRPLIRAYSSRDRQATYILAGEAGKSTRMLITVFDRDQATVIEVKVNAEALMRTLDSPGTLTKSFLGKHDDR